MTSSTELLSFDSFAISAPVLQAIKQVGYETPTLIQARAIPHLLAGHDLVGQAQTGTGKTAAFAIPTLERLELSQKEPQVLVLVPTRELAIQVAEAFQSYARYLEDFHVLPIYGGQSMGNQLRQLKRGAHVIVGTPGRIMDHLRRKSLILTKLTTVILDEADEMLKMGFIEDVEWILKQVPTKRQVALFSATMPTSVRNIASRHLQAPQDIKIKGETASLPAINQRYWLVSGLHKLDALTRMLEAEEYDATIIFVRTKIATEELAKKLMARGYAAAALNGDIPQSSREKVVDQLKKNTIDIIVATDVAARGLDVKRIGHVVNYDIPYDTGTYIHRIGRTGRAGRTGTATLFVAPRERRMLSAIKRATGQPLYEMQLPSHQQVIDRRIERFKQQVMNTLEKENLVAFRHLIQQWAQQEDLSPLDIAAALTYSMQRERPLVGPPRSEPVTHGAPPPRKVAKHKSRKVAPAETTKRKKPYKKAIKKQKDFRSLYLNNSHPPSTP
ncbi:ATP-dependent RNA helicase CsdA [Nitrosococcus oceani ATCC 19707]|uniref:DEAD-box ATP-dependent RNA helicase RhpA n=3 Tax=Nitrosococcus oceani TaxID=1229 RepID=Q3J7Y2_NITOC|nr:DEAD/DEAH box helicase [Nitrosococcus oceani]ABA59064.1 ATP-dependent RNA helicase CsdA [Nitrosococcus oceani ATCC 19707]KFI18489.1 DEAD/DEAH box helicase [Nitrosococcus oceani C-27]GEM21174.1 DEAD/DEAH box helicase [Nitrosococcus oceani]